MRTIFTSAIFLPYSRPNQLSLKEMFEQSFVTYMNTKAVQDELPGCVNIFPLIQWPGGRYHVRFYRFCTIDLKHPSQDPFTVTSITALKQTLNTTYFIKYIKYWFFIYFTYRSLIIMTFYE